MSALVEYDVPDVEYHARPGLSYSGAKVLLDCPARYRYERDHPVIKREYDLGHVAHRLILGKGSEFAICDVVYRDKHPRAGEVVDDWATKDAQTWRDETRAAGKVPILLHEHAAAERMADAVLTSTAGPLFTNGRAEVSLSWVDEQTGVPLRGRFDYLLPGAIVDPKTCDKASPTAIRKSAYDYGYWIQHAAYTEGAKACGLGDLPMIFVFVESKRPHLVTTAQPDPDAAAYGQRRWREAIDLYDACTQAGQWPGYAPDIIDIPLPSYAR